MAKHTKKIDDNTLRNEIEICRVQSLKNGGKCAWGRCAECGVIPLLIKLNKGKLIEDKEKILQAKKDLGIII